MICAGCAIEIGPLLLACPACHTLVHAERLKQLAAEAMRAREAADVGAELSAWREALALLPAGAAQYTRIAARIDQLSADVIAGTPPPSPPAPDRPVGKLLTGATVSAAALFLWKFKALVLIALSKGKLLLLGLTNTTTIFSMLPAIGIYWGAYGWRFALGLVGSIYIHEMGHVAALRRFGIAASAPMFIPGVGAVVRSRLQRTNPREEARVGLAGPIWGLAAAVAAFATYWLTGAAIWAAIGQFGAWVNLFNLIPIWQLDGAHAFAALNRVERWLVTAAMAAMFAFTHEGLLIILALTAGLQSVRPAAHSGGDAPITAQFIGLVVMLSALAKLVAVDAHV